MNKILRYKNKLCILNLLFCLAYIIVDQPDSVLTIKSIAGLIVATLGPILWGEWLYGEMFLTGEKKAIISCRTFLWIGFSFAAVTSIALAFGLLRGTL